MTARLFMLVLIALATCGCSSPLREEAIDSLGDEESGEPGPLHRPGQPCLLCHSPAGGVDPFMSIGGTLFHATSPVPASQFSVVVVDSEGQEHQMVSNACGNFFAYQKDFKPIFPLATEIRKDDVVTNRMVSRIGRRGSCGHCHLKEKGPESPGMIRVSGGDPENESSSCPTPRFLQP